MLERRAGGGQRHQRLFIEARFPMKGDDDGTNHGGNCAGIAGVG